MCPTGGSRDEACRIEIERLASRSASRTSTSPRSAASPRSSSPRRQLEVVPVGLLTPTLHHLDDHLLMFFTGVRRSASDVLAVERAPDTNSLRWTTTSMR